MNNSPELTQRLLGYKPDLDSKTSLQQKLKLNPLQPQSSINTSNSLLQQQLQNDSLNNNNPSPNTNIVLAPPPQSGDLTTNSPASSLQHPYLMHMSTVATSSSSQSDFYKRSPKQSSGHCGADSLEGVGGVESASGIGGCGGNTTSNDPMSPTLSGMTKPPQRRRIRRKATSSPDDQAEHLTEMSVRGLDLFRYASITEGVYQCTECAKENVQKTFKNKYSFQRHAFLYHEGKHRKVFPCPVCGKEFSRPDKMKNHMKTTHECYIPKEVNYHPLNYLITAAAAGEIQQIFPQLESSNAAVPPTTTVSPIKIDKLPLKPENSYNIKSEPPPTPTTESSISLKETEEVK